MLIANHALVSAEFDFNVCVRHHVENDLVPSLHKFVCFLRAQDHFKLVFYFREGNYICGFKLERSVYRRPGSLISMTQGADCLLALRFCTV
jgi:hypothetical protein